MQVLTGHLTQTNKAHIQAILKQGLMCGQVSKIQYQLAKDENGIYTVIKTQKDRGLGFIGSQLQVSQYISTFKL